MIERLYDREIIWLGNFTIKELYNRDIIYKKIV